MKNNWYILGNKLVNNPKKDDYKDEDGEEIKKYHCIKIIEGTLEDMIVESWWVDFGAGTCIDYAFSPTLVRFDKRGNGYLRNEHFRQHNVDPHFLRQVTFPPTFFKNKQKLLRDYFADYIN